MAQRINLTGKKFGKLLIVEDGIIKMNNKGTKSIWCRCLCDCGNEILKRHQNFLSNKFVPHCGCEPDKHSREYAVLHPEDKHLTSEYPQNLFMSKEKYDITKNAELLIKQWHRDFRNNKVNGKVGAIVYVE